MSRVGKKPISVPAGVEVTLEGSRVHVKGPRGRLERVFPDSVGVTMDEGVLSVSRENDERRVRALHGLSRALLANMVQGVAEGFKRELSIVGVGYRAAMKGANLELQLGFSHPVPVAAPDGITFEVPEPTKIIVSGIDKEQVGQVAADIRKLRPPEPYKGKGIRYVDEYVRRKAGKAGKR
ncbi:MAG TPA: 50S ribosomal protein L6 [Acidimicrobiia bacterium]|jgi:large subunit ribosomal protein L6|nr:50S ribosomal protein L6 [Acidimicrobiia bacterium]